MLWLALSYPQLPLEVFDPECASNSRPVVVLEKNKIALCNAAAQKLNILPGSSLATAQAIQEELTYFDRDHFLEQKVLTSLATKLYALSSQVSMPSECAILLEIGASIRLFGSVDVLVQKAIELSSTAGLQAVGGVASTPQAALAFSYSNKNKLSDIHLTRSGIEHAGITEKTISQLSDMGIETLEELTSLPFEEVGKRLGKDILRYLNELTGNTQDIQKPIALKKYFVKEIYCLQPISNKSELYEHGNAPLQLLLKELCHWLLINQLGCEMLIWEFEAYGVRDCSTDPKNKVVDKRAQIPVTFSSPQQEITNLLKMTKLRLDQELLPKEVITVRLKVNRLTSWQGDNHNLFGALTSSEMENNNDQKMDTALLDEINARLGGGSCKGIQSISSITPEHSWKFLDHLIICARHNKYADELSPYKKRPLWLITPPRYVELKDISLIVGPERIQSRWWSQLIDRDYYIAKQKNGAECWVFKSPEDRWYIHGYF